MRGGSLFWRTSNTANLTRHWTRVEIRIGYLLSHSEGILDKTSFYTCAASYTVLIEGPKNNIFYKIFGVIYFFNEINTKTIEHFNDLKS